MKHLQNLFRHYRRCREFEKTHTVKWVESRQDLIRILAVAALTVFCFSCLILRTVHIPSLAAVLVLAALIKE